MVRAGHFFDMALTKIEGGPAWLSSDKYTIEAEADGDQTVPMMYGPMTQVLLEERFQLKIHRETREGPVYELTVAKGGARVQPVRQGPCIASDFAGTSLPFRPGDDRQCNFFIFLSRVGPNVITTGRSRSMEELTQSLTTATDPVRSSTRPASQETWITAWYSRWTKAHLGFANPRRLPMAFQ